MGRLLDRELVVLRQRVAIMGAAVGKAIEAATAALLAADGQAAEEIYRADKAINDQRFALEEEVVTVISTQQPVAGDVRLLVGILEISSELERMGDYAKDIARATIKQADHGLPSMGDEFSKMSQQAAAMLESAMQAFLATDAELATSVARQDDDVDQICVSLHRQLVQQAHTDNASLDTAMRLLPVVHNVERFADRTTNICERVVYIATGKLVEFEGEW